MSGAPAWVSYGALALSAGSLAVSTLAYRAGGPRLALRVDELRRGEDDPFPKGAARRLTVVNAGRAAVTLQGFQIVLTASSKLKVRLEHVSGPTLPLRLEAHASETWIVDALPAARRLDDALTAAGASLPFGGEPYTAHFALTAGNGKEIFSRYAFDVLRLIADADADRSDRS